MRGVFLNDIYRSQAAEQSQRDSDPRRKTATFFVFGCPVTICSSVSCTTERLQKSATARRETYLTFRVSPCGVCVRAHAEIVCACVRACPSNLSFSLSPGCHRLSTRRRAAIRGGLLLYLLHRRHRRCYDFCLDVRAGVRARACGIA